MTWEKLITFCPITQLRPEGEVPIRPASVPERRPRLIVENYEDYVEHTGHEPFHGAVISGNTKEVCVG
jgi:hypothetical protein